MVIEVNKNIDNYKESVVLGLTGRQLIFSIISLIVGGGIVLLTYPYVGLTTSAYIAIPVVAPIALTGFYSYNGMTFVEMMKLKLHFAFGNRTLTYISTEGQMTDLSSDQAEKGKQKKAGSMDNKDDFKKAQKKMILMMILMAVFIVAVGVAAYWKEKHEYTVKEMKVVNPYDEWVTEQTEGESLTLFTCAEHGTKRFVVKCEPVGNTDQQNGEKLDRREGGVYH